jgi:hypothetical protein
MMTMQMLESEGFEHGDRIYRETTHKLKSLELALTFDTPQNHQVTIQGICV